MCPHTDPVTRVTHGDAFPVNTIHARACVPLIQEKRHHASLASLDPASGPLLQAGRSHAAPAAAPGREATSPGGTDEEMTRTFRYCVHTKLLRILALGWVYAGDLGSTHGEWSCLVEWPHDGDGPWVD